MDGELHVESDRLAYAPLCYDGVTNGVVMAGDRVAGAFTPLEAAVFRVLADFAAVGLKNAFRVALLQRSGLRDRETASYNVGYFVDYATKEIYKARRYGRQFTISTFDLDNIDVLRTAISTDVTKTIQRLLAMAVQAAARDSDILSKASEGTFYLLMPETDSFGARMLIRRAMTAFFESREVSELSVPPSVAVGVASWPKDGESLDDLLKACSLRQEEARRSPYRRLRLEDHDYWEMVDLLLETRSLSAITGDSGKRGDLPSGLLDALAAESAKDVARAPDVRGLIYIGIDKLTEDSPLVQILSGLEDAETRVYILTKTAEATIDNPAVTVVSLTEEERLSAGMFFLLLTESTSYGWMTRNGLQSYHTSDVSLIEALIDRLQEYYDLQRQI